MWTYLLCVWPGQSHLSTSEKPIMGLHVGVHIQSFLLSLGPQMFIKVRLVVLVQACIVCISEQIDIINVQDT